MTFGVCVCTGVVKVGVGKVGVHLEEALQHLAGMGWVVVVVVVGGWGADGQAWQVHTHSCTSGLRSIHSMHGGNKRRQRSLFSWLTLP